MATQWAPVAVKGDTGSQGAQGSQGNIGPTGAGLKNAVINGRFDIWQRGTSFSSPASNAFTADRWRPTWSASAIGTYTISRQAFTVGQTDVPGEPTYFLRFDKTVAGTSVSWHSLRTDIEDVRTFAGKQVTLSFYAKAASSLQMDAVVWQNFGTGGSSSVSVINQPAMLTTSWQRFTYTFTMPSISGKTIGTQPSVYLELYAPTTGTWTIDLCGVQLELGASATDFETVPFYYELDRCQRYYWKSFNYPITPATNTGDRTGCISTLLTSNDGRCAVHVRFPRQMYKTPTFTQYSPLTASNGWRNETNSTDGAGTIFNEGPDGFTVSNNVDNGSVGHVMSIHVTAEAELT